MTRNALASQLKVEELQQIKPEISLLLPVYNEAETIEAVISEFYNEICSQIPMEIVVAEDGSTDGTKEILRNLAQKIPMKLILGEKRKGYSKGLIDGLSNVDTEYVVFVDSDGQHLARDFWKLYNLKDEWDIISGWRVKRADGFHRKVMSGVFQLMAKILFKLPPFRDITAPYRLVRTKVAKEIASEFKYMNESFWTEFTIRAYKRGFSVTEIPVAHKSRKHGSTNVYKPKKLLKIVFSQFKGMLKLWIELNKKHD
ncbi:MAG: glycosyltransferase family 2 protein [Candidatus Bathyarchaeia archaeon]